MEQLKSETATPSPAQIDANRANAQLSTGPVTPEGKAASSQNARKHGLTAARVILQSDADREAFFTLESELRDQLQPAGRIEELYFAQILVSSWQIERCDQLHVELAETGTDPLLDATQSTIVKRIEAYYRRNERSLARAMRQLKELQSERIYRECVLGATPAENPIVPALVPVATVQERTRKQLRCVQQEQDAALQAKVPAATFDASKYLKGLPAKPSKINTVQNEPNSAAPKKAA